MSANRPANAERYQKIIDAGQMLMLRNGLRGTTMEAIAREAGVAKPTLYSYFPDKEAVYVAILQRVVDEMTAIASNALSGQGPAADRIAKALGDKHKAAFRLLEGSPHADELYGMKTQLGSGVLSSFETWFEGQIAGVLVADGHPEPHKYAQLIIGCAEGMASKAKHAEEIGPAIRLVARKLLS